MSATHFKLEGMTDIFAGSRIYSIRGAHLYGIVDGAMVLVLGTEVKARGAWVHTRPSWAPTWLPDFLFGLEWVPEPDEERTFCAVVRPQDIQPREIPT
jgi:hypothetical protein